ncbi:Esterase B1 [Orchesella cincta]|uniref:Esterase B1 n=1 Tax=Orchesella cincta TaxID=48709 RepID=A0A1D2MC35_ORCCI|nr:Esterase B1 [Orchesella cincta]
MSFSQSTKVQIAQGWLQGKQLRSREGKEFVGFMGIPFAQNPERFQPAKLPPPSWTGVRDATDYKEKCIQFNLTSQRTEGIEGCLYINVFTPKSRI